MAWLLFVFCGLFAVFSTSRPRVIRCGVSSRSWMGMIDHERYCCAHLLSVSWHARVRSFPQSEGCLGEKIGIHYASVFVFGDSLCSCYVLFRRYRRWPASLVPHSVNFCVLVLCPFRLVPSPLPPLPFLSLHFPWFFAGARGDLEAGVAAQLADLHLRYLRCQQGVEPPPKYGC